MESSRGPPSRCVITLDFMLHYTSSADLLERPNSALSELCTILSPEAMEYRLRCAAEEKFNMLTVIENVLNFLCFGIDDAEYLSTVDLNLMDDIHRNISLATKKVPRALIKSDQTRRIEARFQDILSAVRHAKHMMTGRTIINEPEGNEVLKSEEQWQPTQEFPNKPFNSREEKQFMTKLRQIYITSLGSTPQNLLQQLLNLCTVAKPEDVLQSEAMTDTAIRAVNATLTVAVGRVREGMFADDTFTKEKLMFLLTNIRVLNLSAFVRSTVSSSIAHNKLVQRRMSIASNLLKILFKRSSHLRSCIPRLVTFSAKGNGVNSGRRESALWQKLRKMRNLEDLKEWSKGEPCSICCVENQSVTAGDFAILDRCRHVFCQECVLPWFAKKSECPYCRTPVKTWTTKVQFMAFRRKVKVIGEKFHS